MAAGARFEALSTLRASIFGEVLLARDRVTGDRVAVKTVELALARQQQSRALDPVHEDVLREVDVLEQIRARGGHPNVITLRQCYVTAGGKFLHVVLDYCDGGDLYDACILRAGSTEVAGAELDGAAGDDDSNEQDRCRADPAAHLSTKRLDEGTAMGFFADMLRGVTFLHSVGIAHRDLSLENILLLDGRAVIADFGLCVQRLAGNGAFECTERVGKHYYMAPEVALNQPYDPQRADIWSMGVALFILLTSSPPFDMAATSDPGFRYVVNRGIKAVFKAWGLDRHISDATQDLVARMLAIDPCRRISAEAMWHHPALEGRHNRAA
jgi:calcium-dependent protein kinase